MLKSSKQAELGVDSNRPITPVLRPRNHGLLNPTPSSSKLMIGKQESPYTKIHSITKTRSSSNIKQKSQIKLKNISPNRLSNCSMALKSSDSKRSPLDKREKSHSRRSLLGHEAKEILTEKLANCQKESSLIEIKLNERLQSLHSLSDFSTKPKKLFEIYKETFEEIIRKDSIFSGVLIRIKEAYDKALSTHTKPKRSQDYKERIKDLTLKLNSQIEVSKSQERRIEKLSTENHELSQSLERSEEICTELQKRLCQISNFSVAEIPKDETKWKALVFENKHISETCSKYKEDVNNYKYKEKKLLQLILAMKQMGYPVEDVYEAEVEKKRHKKPMPHYSGSEALESNSETENLVSSRLVVKPKPLFVPTLELAEMQPESISSSSFDSQASASYDY